MTTIDVNGVSIKDSTATGGATFIAYDSTNVSGNTGWTFKEIGVAALDAAATLTADASVISGTSTQNGVAALSADATSAAIGVGRVPALASTDATATATTSGLGRSPGTAALGAAALLTASGLDEELGFAALGGSATVTTNGFGRTTATAGLSATATCAGTVEPDVVPNDGVPVAGPLTARLSRSQTIAAITNPTTQLDDDRTDVEVVSDVLIARLLSRPTIAVLS